uniref:Putative cnidarian restricted protein n=1 Tax=Clytia hemisphaerica TaxID=252671 RepID=A0A069DND6_9CNID
MFKFSLRSSSSSNNTNKNTDEGLSKQQVSTLMRHLSTATSICMVQPPGDADFNKGKKEFRRSMRKREDVDLYKLRKQRMLKQKEEEEKEDEEQLSDSSSNHSDRGAGDCCDNLRRISRIIDAPQSIMEYKDLLKSISLQLFSKSRTSLDSARSNTKYSTLGKEEEAFNNIDRTDSIDDRTTTFVLTQKFIGWKV